jgi:hypothetical protein
MVESSEEIRGGAFYEDEEIVEAYLDHRHCEAISPNLVMEEPAFFGVPGDLTGRRVLDLWVW